MLTIFRPNNLTAFLRCIIFVSESTLRLPLLPLLPFRLPAPSLLPPRGILLISLVSLISHDGLIINQIPTPSFVRVPNRAVASPLLLKSH